MFERLTKKKTNYFNLLINCRFMLLFFYANDNRNLNDGKKYFKNDLDIRCPPVKRPLGLHCNILCKFYNIFAHNAFARPEEISRN